MQVASVESGRYCKLQQQHAAIVLESSPIGQ
jgi:hypothetical protein